MASRLRWLVIVERERQDLYWNLRRRFAGRANVLFDRRTGKQRDTSLTVEDQRRQGRDRRGSLTPPEQHMWERFGYRLVYEGGRP